MGIRFTRRFRVGPFVLNAGLRGLSSVSLRLGPVSWRLWSRHHERGVSSVDLPGPLSYRPPARRRRRRDGAGER